jgi:transcriptional regulator with XRE-family HTH domain
MLPTASHRPVGQLLREWRQRRRLSQLDLAADAAISTRHLSFVETGRAAPSRAMLLKLAEQLQVPLRERNVWLTAAGYAPMYAERALMSDPALGAARAAVEAVLKGHEPHPALAVDRHWNMQAHNRMLPLLLDGQIAAHLMHPPVNVLRLSLHPEGLAPRILNLAEWRAHLLDRLHHQVALTADPVLAALADELRSYPAPPPPPADPATSHAVAVPLRVQSALGPLSFISTTTVFGTPIDITLAELALETFFPADEATAAALRRLHQEAPSP